MTTTAPDLITDTVRDPGETPSGRRPGTGATAALAVLVRRRFSLSVRTPREVLVPLMTPVFFALIIAPALDSIGPDIPGLDYMSFSAIGTAGLLIPLNCMFAGIGVIVDRDSGPRSDLLAAPIARPMLVVANLLVALAITALQVGVLLLAAVLRGAELDGSASGIGWFVGAALLLTIAMYGVAETLANRIPSVEEFTGALPAVAILPFFFAGLYPITALPWALTGFARLLPLTHALALMRYGLLGNATGLEDLWGVGGTATKAALSLTVLAAFAALLTAVALRTFNRTAVR